VSTTAIPDRVIFVVGAQKLVPTLAAAHERIYQRPRHSAIPQTRSQPRRCTTACQRGRTTWLDHAADDLCNSARAQEPLDNADRHLDRRVLRLRPGAPRPGLPKGRGWRHRRARGALLIWRSGDSATSASV
jgi:hypothetical protein